MGHAKPSEVDSTAASSVKTKESKGFFWFVAHGEVIQGPYSTSELKKLVDNKKIPTQHYVWRDGFKEWRPLYGVEEFSRIKENDDLVYPTIAVPGNSVATLQQEKIEVKTVPIYKVRFNRSRWSDLKLSEIAFIFTATLAFTLGIITLSFNDFEKEWSQVWGKRVSAIPYVLGEANQEAIPLYMLDPLRSAPGLKHQENHFVITNFESDMNRGDPRQLNNMNVVSQMPREHFENLDWDKSHTYTRRVLATGIVDLKNPSDFHVEFPLSAYEPLLSNRLAK